MTTEDQFYKRKTVGNLTWVQRDDTRDDTGHVTHSKNHPDVSNPVTVSILSHPKRHDGTKFYVRLPFSENISIAYPDMRDYAFRLTGAYVHQARRVNRTSTLWDLVVLPNTDHSNVSIVLRSNRACDQDGAICSNSNSRLGNTLTLAVAGADGAAAQLPPGTAGEPVLDISGSATTEGDPLPFTITLNKPADDTVTVRFTTVDDTAEKGSDYTETESTLTFQAGETEKVVNVPTLTDTTNEGDEHVTGFIYSSTGAEISRPRLRHHPERAVTQRQTRKPPQGAPT